jgi:hypothetical protein
VITLTKNLMKRTLPPSAWERFRSSTWRFVRPVTVDYCPVMLPWFPAARATSGAGALHRLASSFHWRGQWSPVTALCVGVGAVRWPFQFAVDAARAFSRYAEGVERAHGLSRWQQLKGLVRLGVGSNVPPLYFYRFRLFDPANASRGAEYIHADEMDVLYPTLAVDLPSDQPLRHKEAFYEHATRHGLPVVPPVATFADGEVLEWHDGPRGELPRVDLVLKPVDMACGRGFERWEWDETAGRWCRQGQALDNAEFMARCRLASRGHRHILQRRITNHRGLAALAGHGLSTIRVVTFRRPEGETGVLMACLRMPTGLLQVDNFEAGGIAAPIDLQTGVMGRAVAKDPRRGPFAAHPDSGARIEGVAVPLFRESIDTTLHAHRCFPWVPFVGWDVVVTDAGPLLLEANPNWCVELAQIVMGRPLGDSAYPEIFLAHLASRSGHSTPVTTSQA